MHIPNFLSEVHNCTMFNPIHNSLKMKNTAALELCESVQTSDSCMIVAVAEHDVVGFQTSRPQEEGMVWMVGFLLIEDALLRQCLM